MYTPDVDELMSLKKINAQRKLNLFYYHFIFNQVILQ